MTDETRKTEETEAMKVALARFLAIRGDKGASRRELEVVRDWVAKAELDASLLLMLFDGKIAVDVRDGEVWFEVTPDGVSFLGQLEEVMKP